MPIAVRGAVRDYARQHALFQPGPLLLAVSGGTDSAALLLLLADLREEFGLALHVAHFDHRTRPRDAAADAQLVADLAAASGATFRAGRAERATRSEEDARTARYSFLRRAADAVGATAIATGHTRDDQAETVLLHLARGSGLDGLVAMRPLRGGIARPLLVIGRSETAAVCEAAGIVPREDPTNRSLRFARNRVRRRILPELARINPRIVDALARLADSAAEESEALDAAARELLGGAEVAGAIDLDRLTAPRALRDRALGLAWRDAGGGSLAATHRAALAELAARRDGSARIDLPGGSAVREYGRLRLVTGAVPAPDVAADLVVPLAPEVPAAWGGWRFLLTSSAAEAPLRSGVRPEDAGRLAVRCRRPGDRLAGAERGKVQDLLVDAKVPAARRAAVPLVVGPADRVLWVVGVTPPLPVLPGAPRLLAWPPGGAGHGTEPPRVA